MQIQTTCIIESKHWMLPIEHASQLFAEGDQDNVNWISSVKCLSTSIEFTLCSQLVIITSVGAMKLSYLNQLNLSSASQPNQVWYCWTGELNVCWVGTNMFSRLHNQSGRSKKTTRTLTRKQKRPLLNHKERKSLDFPTFLYNFLRHFPLMPPTTNHNHWKKTMSQLHPGKFSAHFTWTRHQERTKVVQSEQQHETVTAVTCLSLYPGLTDVVSSRGCPHTSLVEQTEQVPFCQSISIFFHVLPCAEFFSFIEAKQKAGHAMPKLLTNPASMKYLSLQ